MAVHKNRSAFTLDGSPTSESPNLSSLSIHRRLVSLTCREIRYLSVVERLEAYSDRRRRWHHGSVAVQYAHDS